MERLTTIRQRLRLSNILTLLVPLLACIAAALICVAVFLVQVRGGLDLEISDAEDMTTMGRVVSETAGHILNETSGDHAAALSELAQSVRGSGATLQVYDGSGSLVWSSGTADLEDELLSSARSLDDTDGVLVSAAGTSLYLHAEGTYHIALFARYAEVRGHAIKRAAAISGVVVLACAIISLLLMDRLGRRLVYDRIESGLKELSDGTERIAQGDLGFRIEHAQADEFAPICQDFNAMAEQLKEASDREIADERRRRELIAGISHDLRSPLTSIQGYVEGLLDGVAQTPEQRKRYLRTIQRKAQELSRLVSELFLFSKLDLEDYPVSLKEMDLADSVRQILDDLSQTIAPERLRIECEEGAKPRAAADPALLQRAIANIVENAAKYAAGGTIWVHLEEEEGTATIVLEDDGPGVPAEERGRLFDVFFRGDPARQHTGSGSGLGLAIVARAMKRMGGTVEAAASSHGGLAMLLHFPEREEKI